MNEILGHNTNVLISTDEVEKGIRMMSPNQLTFAADDCGFPRLMPISKLWLVFKRVCNVSDPEDRELQLTEIKDAYHAIGTRIVSLVGSPVRAWVVADEHGGVIVYNSYDRKTKIYHRTYLVNDVFELGNPNSEGLYRASMKPRKHETEGANMSGKR